jgi:protein involved in polysaccharide export with SLBB domain
VEANRKPAQTGIEFGVPEINWAYAVIERRDARDLSTELIPFHLGKLILERDESENRPLEPADVVTIFSQSDIMVPVAQQNRLVRLEGEFMVAGIYAVRPGETLGQVIERAGGLTPQAYLYGAEFVRESTKHDQQRRLDEFVQEMDHELQQAAAARTRSAVTPQESAEVVAQWENDRQALGRLRGIQSSGRIVLNLEPGSSDLAKLMNLQLEGGDRFVVPARPATVNVLGAVYNQTALLYEGRLRIDDYLRKAGGFTRNADKARVFIIRADGSLTPKQGAASPFVRSFGAMRLYPGDSVIVPEAAFRSSLLRGLRDWSLVFSQFGLGAAAINVLK